MPGVVRPPYGDPTGPLLTDPELADTFLAGARTGHSPGLHVEEHTLLSERFVPVAIRLAPDTILQRADVECGPLEQAAARRGLALVDEEPPLATVVAVQAVGHSAASWQLWAADPGDAAEALRAAATAEVAPPGAS